MKTGVFQYKKTVIVQYPRSFIHADFHLPGNVLDGAYIARIVRLRPEILQQAPIKAISCCTFGFDKVKNLRTAPHIRCVGDKIGILHLISGKH